jgi:hypothetical protein
MSFITDQLNLPNSTNFQFREVSCVIIRDLLDNDIYNLNVKM